MNPLRSIICLMISLYLISCKLSYDKEYYEKASGIIIPNRSILIESFDNYEWCTVTSFKMEPDEMKDFITKYNFKNIEKGWLPTIFGLHGLKQFRPDSTFQNCVWFMKGREKLNITYVVDTTSHFLWASISYPDWGGN